MKATTESNFDALPWNDTQAVKPLNDALIAKVRFLYSIKEEIPKGYRRELIINAWKKIKRYGKEAVLFHWSHNETIMLERLYARFRGVK